MPTAGEAWQPVRLGVGLGILGTVAEGGSIQEMGTIGVKREGSTVEGQGATQSTCLAEDW